LSVRTGSTGWRERLIVVPGGVETELPRLRYAQIEMTETSSLLDSHKPVGVASVTTVNFKICHIIEHTMRATNTRRSRVGFGVSCATVPLF